jgi:enoyl-CoA hydratase/carnithine racemase
MEDLFYIKKIMLLESLEDGISILTISTDKRNTLSEKDLDELFVKLKAIEKSKSILGTILSGTNHVFCTGININTLLNLDTENKIKNLFKRLDEILINLFSSSKPFITAINGHSIGAGFLIQLCSDYTIVTNSPKIKFGLPEMKIGMGIDPIMRDLISFNTISGKKLANIIYSGELFNTEKAISLGIVDEEVEENDLIKISKEKINHLISNDLVPFQINKTVLRKETLNNLSNSFINEEYKIFIAFLSCSKTKEKLRALL